MLVYQRVFCVCLFWRWKARHLSPSFLMLKSRGMFVNNLHNQFPWIRACGGTACNLSTNMLDSCTLLFEEVYVNHAAYEEQRSTTISCSAALVASQDPYATSHRNRQFPSTEKILPGKTLMWWICHVLLQRYHLFDHIFGFTSLHESKKNYKKNTTDWCFHGFILFLMFSVHSWDMLGWWKMAIPWRGVVSGWSPVSPTTKSRRLLIRL